MRSYPRTAFVNQFNYKNATAFFTKMLSSLSSKIKTLEPHRSKGMIFFPDHFAIYDFTACNMLISAYDCL